MVKLEFALIDERQVEVMMKVYSVGEDKSSE